MRVEASEQLKKILIGLIYDISDTRGNLQIMTTFFISHTDESSKAFWV